MAEHKGRPERYMLWAADPRDQRWVEAGGWRGGQERVCWQWHVSHIL